jgi:predicted outer membrane repeat protein
MTTTTSTRFVASLLAIFAGVPLGAGCLSAATYFVDDNPGPYATCLSGDPCPLISTALALTVAGDVVRVAAGTYAESGLVVPHELAILGDAALTTTVDGGGAGPIFIVDAPGGQVLISRLTVTNGDAGFTTGGAIRFLAGDLMVTGSRLVDNEALAGGAISHESTGVLLLLTSTLEGNLSSATGGAISCDSCGGVDIRLSILRDNDAGASGGAVYIELSTLDVWLSAISDNSADYGGGVRALLAPVTIHDSSLMRNLADVDGGAVYGTSTIEIQRSTLAGNSAATNGGAVHASGPIYVAVSNSTFSENTALCGGGFYLLTGYPVGPEVLVGASTLFGNGATSAFCAGHFHDAGTNSLELYNSIVDGGLGNSCNFAMTDGNYNLVDDASCNSGGATFNLGAVTGLDPVLAYNGGPTRTHLIEPTSNAVEAGWNPACLNPMSGNPLVMDQRGQTRPIDFDASGVATCDVGAVELQ